MMLSSRTPLLIGHRGAPLQAPENTIASFRRALSAGADGLELDLQRTSDGVLAVHHDPNVGDRYIGSLTWGELLELVPTVPRFEEVMELMDVNPGAYLNIELKHAVPRPDGREADLARLLDGWTGRGKETAWISSFDPYSLLRLRRLEVELPLALLASAEVELELLPCLPVDAVHPHQRLVDTERVEAWRERGLAIFPWTVNELDAAIRLLDLGVNGLIGDDPDVMLRAKAAGHDRGRGER
jgi:glycerophosphoryl diester phosphodiesterase